MYNNIAEQKFRRQKQMISSERLEEGREEEEDDAILENINEVAKEGDLSPRYTTEKWQKDQQD